MEHLASIFLLINYPHFFLVAGLVIQRAREGLLVGVLLPRCDSVVLCWCSFCFIFLHVTFKINNLNILEERTLLVNVTDDRIRGVFKLD